MSATVVELTSSVQNTLVWEGVGDPILHAILVVR